MMNPNVNMAHVWLGNNLKNNLDNDLNPWYANLHKLEVVSTTEMVKNSQYVSELKQSNQVLKTYYEQLFKVLQEDMPRSLGVFDGYPDKQKMKMVVANLCRLGNEMRSWEIRNLHSIPESARLKQCRLELRGYTKPTIDELYRLADFMATHFSPTTTTVPDFEMNLVPGADMERLEKLMDSFIKHPEIDAKPQPKQNRLLKLLGFLYVADLWPFKRD